MVDNFNKFCQSNVQSGSHDLKVLPLEGYKNITYILVIKTTMNRFLNQHFVSTYG